MEIEGIHITPSKGNRGKWVWKIIASRGVKVEHIESLGTFDSELDALKGVKIALGDIKKRELLPRPMGELVAEEEERQIRAGKHASGN